MIDALERAATPALRAWIEENRARVVAVSQRADKAWGGGSSMSIPVRQAEILNMLAAVDPTVERANAYVRLPNANTPVAKVLEAKGYVKESPNTAIHEGFGGKASVWQAERGGRDWRITAYGRGFLALERGVPAPTLDAVHVAELRGIVRRARTKTAANTALTLPARTTQLDTLLAYLAAWGVIYRGDAGWVFAPWFATTDGYRAVQAINAELAAPTAPAPAPPMPVLDAAHETLLRAFRVAARTPREMGRFNFGPRTLHALMGRWKFPDALRAAVARPTPAGCSSSAVPATLIAPAQVKAVRDALIAEGTIAVAETDRTGRPLAWEFTPTTPFPSMEAYRAARGALFTPQDAPTVEAPAFRSITHGEIERLPTGTRVDTEDGLTHVKLTGEWFLLLPRTGAPINTRSLVGKVRVTPPDARALWALLMDHAYARITLAGGVEVDVDVPTELRALLDAEIQAQDPSAFARRVLATARARTTVNTRLPAIREDAPQLYEGPGFIRVTFAPLTPSVPLRHLTTPTKDTPLSIEEQRKLGLANSHALDWLDDGLTLPPEIDRLINEFERKLTPEEARRMIAWRDSVE